MGWLLGSHTQQEADSSARTFRRHHAWCWNVVPSIPATGQTYDQIQLDGIYLRTGWCCLIAIADGYPIAWQWCDREKKTAWVALMQRITPPTVAVCDGGAGLHAALAEAWPDTKIQRCLVHVQRNIRTYLTSKPRTPAGKTLWALARTLTRITTTDQAITWLSHLHAWEQLYGHLTRQRTYATAGADAPSWVRPGQRWWYTHDRLRRAYRLLHRLGRDQHLFTYLAPDLAGLGIDATTNKIEGGINAGLRDLLRRHRGMTEHHQRRAIEWWLYQHSAHPQPPATLIQPEHYQPSPKPALPEEPIGPAGYDTATTAEEGLWNRRGWAGRT